MTGNSNSKTNGATALEKVTYDPNAASAIEVEHIVKKYGDFTAVHDDHPDPNHIGNRVHCRP